MLIRALKWLPLLSFLGLIFFLWQGLSHDPKLLPSRLTGKHLPNFNLISVENSHQHLIAQDLQGQVILMNVWASWCVACQQEHSMLLSLSGQQKVPIYGLNWKDNLIAAQNWLQMAGDPYQLSGFDATGRTAIDLGVYGVPETFVVDKYGMIRYRHAGPVTPAVWREVLWPIIQKWQNA